MRKTLVCAGSCLLFLFAQFAAAQVIQVSRTNKTIEVSLTESIRVDPEVAVVRVGYQNYGQSKDGTYEENVRKANQIVQALLDAGISKEAIETETVRLERASEQEYPPPAAHRKEQEYTARQNWTVGVSISEAQKVVDLAVNAGANLVEDVNWTVAESPALEAKANAAALAKAQALAEKMALQLGAKIGELLYLSNREPNLYRPGYAYSKGGELALPGILASAKLPLKLFPAKFERSATVTAVFALE